jgi:hypothetical protein
LVGLLPANKVKIQRPHPTDSLQDLRRKYGGPGASGEEVLLRFFGSKEDVDRMRAGGPARSYTRQDNPLVNLVENLSKQNHRNSCFYPEPQLFPAHGETARRLILLFAFIQAETRRQVLQAHTAFPGHERPH